MGLGAVGLWWHAARDLSPPVATWCAGKGKEVEAICHELGK